jgi:hypothetical protein
MAKDIVLHGQGDDRAQPDEDWAAVLGHFQPDGMTAAAGSEDRSVVAWDLADE